MHPRYLQRRNVRRWSLVVVSWVTTAFLLTANGQPTGPPPSIKVFSSPLKFSAREGDSNVPPAMLTISNVTGFQVLWLASNAAPDWLSLSAMGGSLAAGASTQLVARVIGPPLKAADRETQLTFLTTELALRTMIPRGGIVNPPPVIVSVILIVAPRPPPAPVVVPVNNPVVRPPLQKFNWLKWIAWAAAIFIGLAGIIHFVRKPPKQSHAPSSNIEIKIIKNVGVQSVKARHSLLAPFLRIQVKKGAQSFRVRTPGRLINTITKLKG